MKEDRKVVKDKLNDGFLMSPKIDFAFKLLFGDEKNKDLLIAFLNAVLKMPDGELLGIELINTELLREFAEDKKGILDVRAKLRNGKQIDIEIQVIETEFMPERSLFYWSKMYTGQIKPGDTYDKLKKCITINIVDFVFLPIKKLYSSFHLLEDETGHKLTDVLEVHFLELPKLFDDSIPKDEDDPIVEWMMFIDGKSKGVMEMLAEKNEKIKKAYDVLKVISQDERARILYEAREAEIRDQLTRIHSAKEEGKIEGRIEVARNLLDILDVETIAQKTGLTIDEVKKLKH
jgi:predicted transposase/invertase (TIGR01784 family)